MCALEVRKPIQLQLKRVALTKPIYMLFPSIDSTVLSSHNVVNKLQLATTV